MFVNCHLSFLIIYITQETKIRRNAVDYIFQVAFRCFDIMAIQYVRKINYLSAYQNNFEKSHIGLGVRHEGEADQFQSQMSHSAKICKFRIRFSTFKNVTQQRQNREKTCKS